MLRSFIKESKWSLVLLFFNRLKCHMPSQPGHSDYWSRHVPRSFSPSLHIATNRSITAWSRALPCDSSAGRWFSWNCLLDLIPDHCFVLLPCLLVVTKPTTAAVVAGATYLVITCILNSSCKTHWYSWMTCTSNNHVSSEFIAASYSAVGLWNGNTTCPINYDVRRLIDDLSA